MPAFHETRMGVRFIEGELPTAMHELVKSAARIARSFERIADSVCRALDREERRERPMCVVHGCEERQGHDGPCTGQS